jgi:hypothetical protein
MECKEALKIQVGYDCSSYHPFLPHQIMFLISQFMPGFVQARCLHMPEALETA